MVTCMLCGRVWRVAPFHLYRRFEPNVPLIWAGRRLLCRRCGARGEALGWHIERASLDGPPDPPMARRGA